MVSLVLFSKDCVQHPSLSQSQLLYGLLNTLRGLDDHLLMLVLTEVVATQGDLRALSHGFHQMPAWAIDALTSLARGKSKSRSSLTDADRTR